MELRVVYERGNIPTLELLKDWADRLDPPSEVTGRDLKPVPALHAEAGETTEARTSPGRCSTCGREVGKLYGGMGRYPVECIECWEAEVGDGITPEGVTCSCGWTGPSWEAAKGHVVEGMRANEDDPGNADRYGPDVEVIDTTLQNLADGRFLVADWLEGQIAGWYGGVFWPHRGCDGCQRIIDYGGGHRCGYCWEPHPIMPWTARTFPA
jgi:hypothetical protein